MVEWCHGRIIRPEFRNQDDAPYSFIEEAIMNAVSSECDGYIDIEGFDLARVGVGGCEP